MEQKTTYQPKIFRSVAVFLQAIQLQASRGYSHFIEGEIDEEKINAFMIKMHEKFSCCASHVQKCRNKKLGIAGTWLAFVKTANMPKAKWIILVSGGNKEIGIWKEEFLYPIKRLNAFGRYELRKYYRSSDNKYSYSWQLNEKTYGLLVNTIKSHQHSKSKMQFILDRIGKLPGFHLLKEQKSELVKTRTATADKSFREQLILPPKLFFTRFMKHEQ
ncbi:hypothetical protein HQ393_13360 [Chitinibacter bivalviorum]|uniref:Uncharacterized protein n=1 Tax=Chitinibacter bivalviorum TaxID=2739434 RepID=A0A7H9BIW2_9NEIS|nr:hypothetical protein [Chitinibacter bivalviorum]QLG88419.1 hypothetical protein HQ393_09245 [Chitinibacter bivalviorum]QLG89150.1 hypothetical protein HQ393_13360 [Chitinibacter bivalviorum]